MPGPITVFTHERSYKQEEIISTFTKIGTETVNEKKHRYIEIRMHIYINIDKGTTEILPITPLIKTLTISLTSTFTMALIPVVLIRT